MSVILECQPGDSFVCIGEFHACPEGEPFSLDASRKFRIGERLRYVGFRQHQNLKDHAAGWLVVFEAADGKHYAATQTYFVIEETWEKIKKYFAQRLLREPKPKRTTRQKAPGDG
jgi:hypothetical protein